MKTCLVLEGGAMRGMYTAGVLDVLLEKNIKFDAIIGVSAGALFGVNYVSKQRGRVIRYNKRFNKKRLYMGIIPYLREGNIVSTKYAYERVPKSLDPFDNEEFKKSDTRFIAVTTNIITGEAEYFNISDVFKEMDILRASGSLPLLSKPVKINDKLYLDGGISDSVPYEYMINQGYEKIVVVLTRDLNYKKEKMSNLIINRYKKYPKFKLRLSNRHIEYNKQIEGLIELEKEKKAFVIRPSKEITIKKMERKEKNLQQVYELGINDCNKDIEEIMKYLANI